MLSLASPSPTSLLPPPPPPPLSNLHSNPSTKPSSNLHFSTSYELAQLHARFLKSSLSFPPNLPRTRTASLSPSTFSYSLSLLRHYSTNRTFYWNTLLRSLSPSSCLSLFLRLHLSNFPFDTFSFCIVLKCISSLKYLSTGRAVHAWIEKLGFMHDLFVLNVLLHMYVSCGKMDVARFLFDRMPVRNAVTWNTLIIPMTKSGDMESAREMFDRMPTRSVRSWNAMIAGYVQSNNPKEAVELFLAMQGVLFMRPGEVTLVAILAACADLRRLDLGQKVHGYAVQCRFEKNVRICNTLIDMYMKCGSIDVAREVFDGMPDQLRTVVSWSTMICGYAMHGQGEKALELFSRMTQQGFQPNGFTFIGVLHACCHMGLVTEGLEFFERMKRDYNIVPRIEHFDCTVDLLVGAGLEKEALELYKQHVYILSGTVLKEASY
ncbi:Pentatricopeptide repeat-containing protein [Rhynchospora pubera]|uniref:Pentatricopeptide repeat-containing protein n=1 Tax=Rhynchospora pubera TaxID=906938 RepID=A0AAV8FMH2_9POAL|nr:Pentatricopeptide repeat-containing protein [Rhynchospora pubera]